MSGNEKGKLLEEWHKLFEGEGEYYIYGAANTAKKILQLARTTEVADKIKGFVVTNGEENYKEVENLPVLDIHNLQNKQAVILVPHAGLFKEQIYSLLETLGFVNILLIHRFCYFVTQMENESVEDSFMEEVKKQAEKLAESKSIEEKELDASLRETIMRMREEGQPDFGQVQFYQSFEKIGVSGTRPSLYRVAKYGLETFLNEKQDVLDIGCNTGFLDMTVAARVHSITGVEYDACLVSIADCVKNYLHADNCEFINSDFHDWYAQNDRTFDVIFSFAIHHWLNIKPEEYAQRINYLLNPNGYLCFESHDLSVPDREYEACLNHWLSMGWSVVKEDMIMDDGITKRKFTVLKKPE